MKKICSVIVSCALLLGLLIVPGTAAEPQQIFQGFEGEIYSAPNSAGEKKLAYFSKYEKAGDDDQNVRSGNYSLKLTAGSGTCWAYLNDKLSEMTVGKTYQLEFYAKRSASVAGSGNGMLALKQNPTSDNVWTGTSTTVTWLDQWTSTDWKKYSLTFEATTKWCSFEAYSSWELYIDDLTITEVAPVTVDFKEADGTVIDQRMGLPGSALTLPRTPEKEGYSFDGWYEDADFTTAFTGTTFPTASKSLYAKFKDVSIYDSYTDTAAQYPTSTDGGDTAPTLSAADGILSLTGKSAKEKRNAWISLTPATSEYATTKDQVYRVEFDVKATYNAAISGVLGTYGNEWVTSAKNQTEWHTNGAATEWQHLSATITSNGTTLRACVWGLPTGETIQFKNLKITPVTVQTDLEKAVAAELEYQGSSLRPEDAEKKANPISGNNGEAAIRFKSKISNKLLNEGITVSKVHYSVVEYGHTYFREDLMGGNTVLDIGTAYTSGKAAKNAVAYRKENGAVTTDIWFSKDATNVTYTAALYNFTEQSYTLTYVARPYVKLVADNSTEEITVYGANTQFAAFNDVADRAFYAHPGDVYNRAAAYTDVNGDSWSESYEIRSALYNTVLSKLSGQGFNYLAPAAAAE